MSRRKSSWRRLETYKDRMRGHINHLSQQINTVKQNPKDKKARAEGLTYVNEALAVCDENYVVLMQSLEAKLKNDQRIAEAKSLSQKLSEQAENLRMAINEAKKSNSWYEKFKAKLEDLVNGEG